MAAAVTLNAADIKRLSVALAQKQAFQAGSLPPSTSLSGSGSPEGVVTALPGTTYVDVVGNTFWVKQTGTGNTGWLNVTSAPGPPGPAGPPGPPGPAASIIVSAGSTSANLSQLTFSDSNGVSFGFNNSTITATVATNYQSIGAYLTTAMASNKGSDFVQAVATFYGTNASGTIASNAISVSVSPPSAGNINISAGSTSSNVSAVTFSNGSGVTFGFDGSNVTASVQTNYQIPGAYLTTAALSQDSSKYAGTTAGITGGSLTVNTAGVAISLPAYLTTAQPPGAYLTTAALSQDSSKYAGINGSMVGGSFTLNTSGATISLPAYLTTAQPPGAYLTTAALSQDSSKYAGTSTGIAGGSVTLNTAGISISLPAYLTTAALSGDTSKYAGTSTGIAGGSVTLNTAGISINLPAYLTTFAFPRLDQVLDPTADKVFSMGSNQLQLSWNTGGSFSTNATRQGMFELDVQGNLTQEADVVHVHQHGGAPTKLDMLHVEGDGANVTGLRLQMSASVAAEVNQPIKFTTADTGYAIGSVPMILGTSMSNVVANLNANYLQGSQASQFAASNVTSARAGTATSVVTTTGTDLSMALDTSGLTVAYPKWLTTATGGGGAGTNTSVATTGGTDLTLGVNTSGVTIGYPKWITTYVNDLTSGRAGVNTSVATTAGTDLSCALNTSGLTIAYPAWITTYVNDLTSQRCGTNTSVATTAGTDLSFAANTSGITIAYPKWITTAAVAATLSQWQNMPRFLDGNSTLLNTGISVLHVQPFTLQQGISFAFLRLPISMSQVSSETAATTANVTWTYNRTYTIAACIHTQNVGASSLSLANYISSLASFVFQYNGQAGAQGSRYTVSQNVTYPIFGTTSVMNANSAQSSANIGFSTNLLTNFTALRWLDIPWATSLSAGNYWLALGYSSNSATTGGIPAGAAGASMALSYIGVSQSNVTFGRMGEVTNSSVQGNVGMGSWSTNSAIMSSGSLQLASISQISSQPVMLIQFQRFA